MGAPEEIAYRVKTARLELRGFEPGDAAELSDALVEEQAHLAPFVDVPAAPSLSDALALIRRWRARFDGDLEYVYAVRDVEGQLVGCIGVSPDAARTTWEIGGWLRQAATARGLGSEAVAALAQLVLARPDTLAVELRCVAEHPRTPLLAARLGFARRRVLDDGRLAFTLARGEPLPATVALTAYDALGRRIAGDERPAANAAEATEPDWPTLVAQLQSRFSVRARGDDAVVLVTRHRFGDAQAEQDVEVLSCTAFGAPWLIVRAFVGSDSALSLHEALQHNATLAYGALVLEHEVLLLRHALPLAAGAEELARVVRELGRETARLRARLIRAVAGAPDAFAYLVE